MEERRGRPWLFAIVPILLGLAAAGWLLGRRKRPPPEPRDAAWAAGELADPAITPDRCATILRQYLAWRFGVPAAQRTTPELASSLLADSRLPAEAVAAWRAFLDECDAVRFSGTAGSVAGLADRARTLVEAAEEQVRISHEKAQKDTKSTDESQPRSAT
jgi:hypothetical protein